MRTWLPKALITLLAVGAILARIIWPELRIDAVALGLSALAMAPWLSSVIKSLELPGMGKVEFQDLEAASKKIGPALDQTPRPSGRDVPKPSVPDLMHHDPNLALVGLRIEVERRLRELAGKHGLPVEQPLTRLFEQLRREMILDGSAAAGLENLIHLGNQAAHGAQVTPRATAWAFEWGPKILTYLDAKVLW